ncbi:MAG: zinc ribbon domain-containing protein [Kiloniellales bacterium]
MSQRVTRKLEAFTAEDPLGRAPGDDPWAAFREIERIELDLEFQFRHSLGKLSRFFLELENRKLFGTTCPACGKVWMPPRVHCAEELAVTEWTELPGRGTLQASVSSAYTLTGAGGADRLVLGYVRLEGADTLLLQQIRNYGEAARLAPGLPVQAVWSEDSVGHPMESFWFEPA